MRSGININRIVRNSVVALACFAVLLISFAPLISNLLVHRASQAFSMEWCSPVVKSGNKVDKQVLSSSPASSDHCNFAVKCPFCYFHVWSITPSEMVNIVLFCLGLMWLLPRLFYHSPYSLFIWASFRARAPPFSFSHS